MHAAQTIQSFFCLAPGRVNFDLDPATDNDFLFGDQQWSDEIDKRIQRSIVMGRPLRHVWWGQYGIGKTHRLRYTKKVIETKNYAYFPVFAIASDLEDKSGFERLHSQLLAAIGYESVKEFAEKYTLRLLNGEQIPSFTALADTSSDVASAFRSLGSQNVSMASAAWKYLSGQKLDRQDVALASVGKPQIDTALEFAVVHHVIGHLVETQNNAHRLVYLIDEVENLTKIKNKNAATRWQESLKALLDVKNIGLVFAVGAENMQGLPSIIVMPDIVRRIQMDNYEQMSAFKTATAEKFLRDLLGEFVDPTCRSAKEASNGWVDGTNDYEAAIYPFTKKAFQIFCSNATTDVKSAKPSEILNHLNNAAYETMLTGSQMITPEVLKNLKMS